MEDFSEGDSDYEEDTSKRCFKISQLDNCPDFFFFLCCLLRPLLKTLEQAAAFLVESGCPESELAYVERLQQFLVRKAQEDGSFGAEEAARAHSPPLRKHQRKRGEPGEVHQAVCLPLALCAGSHVECLLLLPWG